MNKLIIIVTQAEEGGPVHVERYNEGFNRLNHIEVLADAIKEVAADYIRGVRVKPDTVTKALVDARVQELRQPEADSELTGAADEKE